MVFFYPEYQCNKERNQCFKYGLCLCCSGWTGDECQGKQKSILRNLIGDKLKIFCQKFYKLSIKKKTSNYPIPQIVTV